MNKETEIESDYTISEEILGEGSYGIVRKATEKDTGEIRAIKTIRKNKIQEKKRFLNELNILKTLDHPNIVKLFEIYEDEESIHLVMEYCSGGELFDYILKQEVLDEYESSKIIKQILHAILYCHKNAICHRDLKPENFMFESKEK